MAGDPNATEVSVHEILPGLWLGNQAAATSDFVPQRGILTVVNCTTHIPCPHAGVRYHRVPVLDPGPGNGIAQADVLRMARALAGTVELIAQERRAGRPILVHCHAGAQRSACVVTAYLLSLVPPAQRDRQSLETLIREVIRRRPRAFFGGESVNFYPALVQYMRTAKA